MGWVRLEDDFYDHFKFAEAGPLGLAQWIAGLAYCNRNLTDGHIPMARARTLIDWDGIMWDVDTSPDSIVGGGAMVTGELVSNWLVECGLWDEDGKGYSVHDYLTFQPSRDEVGRTRQTRHEQRVKGGKARVVDAERDANGRLVSAGQNQQGQLDTSNTSSIKPGPNPNPNKILTLCDFDAEFGIAWKQYPRKEYRKSALDAYIARRNQQIPAEELLLATINYAKQMEALGRDKEHILLGSTFYGPKEKWKDHLEETKERFFSSGSMGHVSERLEGEL